MLYIMCFVALFMAGLGRSKPSSNDEIFHTLDGGMEWRLLGNTASVKWKRVQVEGHVMLKFTLTGKAGGYIAMATSADRSMDSADDAYMCLQSSLRSRPARNSFQIFSAHFTEFQTPVVDSVVEEQDIVETSDGNNTLTCVFHRPLRVTKKISGKSLTWDYSTEAYHILYAQGDISEKGIPLIHEYNASTVEAFRFGEEATSEQEQSQLSLPQIRFENNMTVSTNDGTWTLNCDSNNSSCNYFQWKPVIVNGSEMMKITLIGNDVGWIGILITGKSIQQGGGSCYVCYQSEDATFPPQVTVGVATCSLAGPPVFHLLLRKPHVIEAGTTNGKTTCSFLRPIREFYKKNEPKNGLHTFLYSEGLLKPTGGIGIPLYLAVSKVFLRPMGALRTTVAPANSLGYNVDASP